jgi:hypothetical protein
MALTINPAVSGSLAKWMRQTVLFLFGVLVGGLVALFIVLMVERVLVELMPRFWVVLFVVCSIGWAILHDLGLPLPLPYRRVQVPEWFRRVLPPEAVASIFGVQLGIGFLTLPTYSSHLAFLLVLPFADSFTTMLALMGVFALGKTLVLATTIGARSIEEVGFRFRWTPIGGRILRLTTATTSTILGLVLLGTT